MAWDPSADTSQNNDQDPYEHQDNEAILASQQSMIKKQDNSLDLLYDSVKRTQQIHYAIGDELVQGDKVIEEFTVEQKTAQKKVVRETRSIKDLMKKSSSKKPMCLICILMIIVIVLVSITISNGW